MLYPLDPTLLIEEQKKRRSPLVACGVWIGDQMASGKTLIQRIRSHIAGS